MKRFYAEHTDLNPIFKSQWNNGWQIFDRNHVEGPLAIAFCTTRTTADTIRDALNTAATIRSQERATSRPTCKHWTGCARAGKCLHFATIYEPLNSEGT